MKRYSVALILILATGLGSVALAEANGEAGTETTPPSPVEQLLQSDFRPGNFRLLDERRAVWNGVKAIYKANDMQPLWTGSRAAKQRARQLISKLLTSSQHGLIPREYDAQRFADAFRKRNFARLTPDTARDATSLDVSLTSAMLAYAHDIWDGRVEPADVRSEHEVYLKRDTIDPVKLWKSIEEDDVASALTSLEPQHEHYKALTRLMKEALARKDKGGFTKVTTDYLKRGDRGEAVYALIKRLCEGGYLYMDLPKNSEDAVFDRGVEAALQRVQRESALKEDGIYGPATAAILNQSVEKRIERLAINMDRWRWLPRDMGEQYLWVNIPDYRLRVFGDGEEQWSTRIIAGTSVHRTPVFADKLEYIVFSPSWHVPKSIIGNELIPMFRNDPKRVNEKNMEITDVDGEVLDPMAIDWSEISAADINVRQKPGPSNALGRVKFIFPNRYAIYLHDTPSDHLFENSKRSFSHGCIRVSEPQRLADYLLRDDDDWTEDKIETAMSAEEAEKAYLGEPLPVYITYFTAMPDSRGDLRLLADVYEHDQVMAEALSEETPKIAPTRALTTTAAGL
ncbi:MAG: L,D-transpeptidase family protein [Woeseia sp.]|nr:L,D-transpeptidase family protein [Woeseia sp.]